MAKNIRELRELRVKAVTDARSIVETADKANRSMTEDEKRQYGLYIEEAKRLKEDIDVEERTQDLERELAGEGLKNVIGGEQRGGSNNEEVEKRTLAFRKLILQGEKFMTSDEIRSLTSGVDTQGGFLNAPQEFVQQLIVAVKNRVFMRGLATIIPLNGSSSAGVPTLDTDIGDADWTPEVKTVSEDNSLAFGKRELTPHALSKLAKVSNKLLRSAALNPEAIVMDRMAYKFGIAMEKGYMVGNGSQQPLGIFTASTDGIPTSRDYSTGNGTTTISADNLIGAKYNLKPQYRGNSQWIFHRDAVSQLAKLKDGDGQYLFRLSDIPDQADRLLGRPLIESEYAPNTFTTGLYVGMLGDYSNYWIADSLALSVQRLNELYAESNKVGFIGRMETDGMPVLSESFVRIKLA